MNALKESLGHTHLERLRDAYETLTGQEHEWAFGNWNSCTCGHIYAAAHGDRDLIDAEPGAPSHVGITKPWEDGQVYRELLDLVCKANALGDGYDGSTAWAVSDATENLAMSYDEWDEGADGESEETQVLLRDAAAELVLNTIRMVEKEQTDAMEVVAGG